MPARALHALSHWVHPGKPQLLGSAPALCDGLWCVPIGCLWSTLCWSCHSPGFMVCPWPTAPAHRCQYTCCFLRARLFPPAHVCFQLHMSAPSARASPTLVVDGLNECVLHSGLQVTTPVTLSHHCATSCAWHAPCHAHHCNVSMLLTLCLYHAWCAIPALCAKQVHPALDAHARCGTRECVPTTRVPTYTSTMHPARQSARVSCAAAALRAACARTSTCQKRWPENLRSGSSRSSINSSIYDLDMICWSKQSIEVMLSCFS